MTQRTFLTSLADFPASGRATFKVGDQPLLVIQFGDSFFAIVNKCPHLNLPLTNGKVEGETITCPFHGSKFDLKSGENLDWVTSFVGLRVPQWSRRLLELGKRPTPLTVYKVVVEDGKLYVE